MYQISNFMDNDDIKTLANAGPFTVIEYERDLSVMPSSATVAYFSSKMNVRKRQVVCDLSKANVTIQAGAMQWMAGNIQATTGVKGAGDLFGKLAKGFVTKESAIKPEYVGSGYLMLEPTYKYLLLEDVSEWEGGLVLEDGMYLASEGSVKLKTQARKSVSSAVLGNEGLFNLKLVGEGIAALESNVMRQQLVEVVLNNDVLKVDGNLAVCWSGSLDFTVERSGKTLVGSAVSGEGLVNVYRGSGRVYLSTLDDSTSLYSSTLTKTVKSE